MEKLKVLLIDPSAGLVDESEWGVVLGPNLGLAYIGSFLKRESKAEIRIVEMFPLRLSITKMGKMLMDYCPNLVGITAKTFNVLIAYELAGVVKRTNPGAVVVLGGAHGTALPELTLTECTHIDAIVRGEGEITMREIVLRLSNGVRDDELFSGVTGLSYRARNGEIIHNDDRPLIPDLDSLPFPDYSMYDLRLYGKLYNPRMHRFSRVFSVLGSRGCPYSCTFCYPLLTRRIRYRSVLNVLEEIELLSQRYNAHRIYFEDSTFTVNKEWFEEFCEGFTSKALHEKVEWGFETRVDLVQEGDIFEAAKASGCTYAYFGIESANDSVLRHAKKRITRGQAYRAVQLARRAGINAIGGSFVFGLPYETRESIKETIEFIRELHLDVVNLNIVDVYPGTELYEMVDRGEGGIRWLPGMRDNWESYSRRTCQTVANDLTEKDLVDALNHAHRVFIESTRRQSITNFMLKVQAYLRYYARNDPKQCIKYAKRLICGLG